MKWYAALDCTFESGSLCLASVSNDDHSFKTKPVQFFRTCLWKPPQKHSEQVIPLLQSLLLEQGLKPKDIFRWGVCVGPGSFTGIRVGLSFTKALAYACQSQLFGINSFNLIYSHYKKKIPKDFPCFILIPALRDIFYIASFDKEGNLLIPPKAIKTEKMNALLSQPTSIILQKGNLHSLFPSLESFNDKQIVSYFEMTQNECLAKTLLNSLISLPENEAALSPLNIHPFYLRDSEPEEKLKIPSS